MSAIICTKRFNANRVSWDRLKKKGVVEASDLAPAREGCFDRLYSDACDVGLVLLSPTGKLASWYVGPVLNLQGSPIRQGDDVGVFILKPTTETLRANPQLKGWELHVLND